MQWRGQICSNVTWFRVDGRKVKSEEPVVTAKEVKLRRDRFF
jgi:hypothetical protein